MEFGALAVDLDLIINGVNYSLLVGLFFAFLIGFLKGARRSFVRFLTRIIPLLILLVFLDVFALSIIDYNFATYFSLEQGNTLHEIVLYYVSKSIDVVIIPGSEIDKLVLSLSLAIARVIVFYVGVVICLSITAILNLIIYIIFKITDRNKEKKRKRFVFRLLGALFSGITYIGIFVIVLLPLFGPISMVSDIEEELRVLINSSNDSQITISQEEPSIDDLFEMVHEFDRITFRSIFNAFGRNKRFDALYFGYLTRIQTKEGTINMAYLIDDIKDGIYFYGKYFNQESPNYNELLSTDEKRLENLISRQKIIGIIAPAGIEYMEAKDFYKSLDLDYLTLKMIDWKLENEAINEIFKKTINLLKVADFDYNEPLKGLDNPEIDEAFGDLGLVLSKSKLFTKVGLPFINQEIDKYLSSLETEKNIDLSHVKASLDFSQTTLDEWKENFITLSNLARAMNELGLFEGEFTYDDSHSDALKRLIMMPFKLSMIKNHEEGLFEEILSFIDIRSKLTTLGLETLDFTDINWETESTGIADIMEALLDVFGENEYTFDNFLSQIESPKMTILIDKVLSSNFFRTNITLIIDHQLITLVDKQESLTDEQKTELKSVLKFNSLDEESIKSDVHALLEIYKNLNEMNIFSDKPNDFSNYETLKQVLIKIFSLKVVRNHESQILNLMLDLVNLRSTLDNLDIVLNTDDVDWDKEPTKLAEIITAFSAFGDLNAFDMNNLLEKIKGEGGADKVKNLLNAFCASDLFTPNIPVLIDKALSSAHLDEWYSDWFNSQLQDGAEIDQAKWQSEVNLLANILLKSQDGSLDLNNISFNNPSSLEALKELLLLLNQSDIFKLDLIKTYLESAINDHFKTTLVITTLPTKENWASEINTIFEIANLLNNIGTIDSNDLKENNPNIINLLELISDSIMLKPLQKTIVQEMINKSGFSDYLNIDEIDFDNIDWSSELLAINKIINQFDNLSTTGRIENLNEDTIELLMLDASGGQMASLIIGKILNEQFNDIFGNKNPTVNGKLKYDFTKPTTLSSNASSMGKLISLGNTLKDLFVDNSPSSEKTNKLSESVKNLHEEGKERPTFIDDYLPSIMKFAGKETEISSDGLANSNKTYVQEGEMLEEFFNAFHEKDEKPIEFAKAINNINENSYLAKEICSSWFS